MTTTETDHQQKLHGRDLISIDDLSKEEIFAILDAAQVLKQNPKHDLLQGLLLGSCFFEPSTRTRLSFEAAVSKLGGTVVGFSDDTATSTQKGESLGDSIKIIDGYVDAIVIRHPHEGSARLAAETAAVPVINAGDGANQHPTQTLLDLFTIRECQGRLEKLNIAMVGDLKHGRTVHSLAQACTLFGSRLYFVAPPSLEMPRDICTSLKEKGLRFSFHQELSDVLPKADILYMTRIQKERFADPTAYETLKRSFTLKSEHLSVCKSNLKVMHPLPRLNEIDRAVDATDHAHYFTQAHNGLWVRQALLALILGKRIA